MKRQITLCVVLVCAVIVWAQPAAAVVYDFNGLSAGDIGGQDNWVGTTGLKVYANPGGGAPHPGDGLVVTSDGGTPVRSATRTNDSNWSYDVSSGQQFYAQFDFSTDYQIGASYGHGKVDLTSSATGSRIGMGFEVLPWYYAPLIRDAFGTETNGGTPRPPSAGRTGPYSMRMEIDPLANSGQGTATALLKKTYLGETTYTAISGLSDVNLRLADAGMTAASLDGLQLSIKTRLLAIDNVEVGYIPSDTLYWDGDAGSNWTTLHWLDNIPTGPNNSNVPTADTYTYMTNDGLTFVNDAQAAKTLQISLGTVQVQAGGTLTVGNKAEVTAAAGILDLAGTLIADEVILAGDNTNIQVTAGATLQADTALTVNSSLNMVGSTLATTGSTDVTVGSTATLAVDAALTAKTLTVEGTGTLNSAGVPVTAETINIDTGGTWSRTGGNVTAGSALSLIGDSLSVSGPDTITTTGATVTIGAGKSLTYDKAMTVGGMNVEGTLDLSAAAAGQKKVTVQTGGTMRVASPPLLVGVQNVTLPGSKFAILGAPDGGAPPIQFVYDFDHLNLGALVGQDNWTGTNGGVVVAAGPTGNRLSANTYSPGTFKRANDANWSYALAEVPSFSIEWDLEGGYSGWGNDSRNVVGFTKDGVIQFEVGWYTDIGLNEPGQAYVNGENGSPRTKIVGQTNRNGHYKLDVTVDNPTSGTAAFSFDGSPIMSGIPINFLSAPSEWNDLYIKLNSYCKADNLTISGPKLGPISLTGTDFTTSGAAEISALTGTTAALGAVSMAEATVLTTSGPMGQMSFTGTTIDSGATAVTFNTLSDTATGAIDGNGNSMTITKTGAKALILGTGTGLGSTLINVQAGRLETPSAITIGGLWVAGGTVAPGGSPGVINVAGNAVMGDGSVYEFERGDRIKVTGDLDIDEGWKVKLLDSGLQAGGQVGLMTFGTYDDGDWTTANIDSSDLEGTIDQGVLDGLSIITVGGHLVLDGLYGLMADANLDYIVDISDFFVLKTNFDKDPAVWTEGNFNEDSLVDISDFFILKANFDATYPAAGGAAAPTPEPATLCLLGLGGMGLLLKRRRR